MKKLISILSISILIFAVGCAQQVAQKDDTQDKDTEKINQESITKPEMIYGEITENTMAVLETSEGTIKIKFYPEEAPDSVRNFVELVEQGKYKDVPIHRVIPDFMIQMGDFENGNGTGGYSYKGPGTTVKDEPSAKRKHVYGAVSMAKTSAPNSAGSQFFIVNNKEGASFLDGGYSVFGYVVEGMDVVEKISAMKTTGPPNDRPLEEVTFSAIEISEDAGA